MLPASRERRVSALEKNRDTRDMQPVGKQVLEENGSWRRRSVKSCRGQMDWMSTHVHAEHERRAQKVSLDEFKSFLGGGDLSILEFDR